MPAWGAFVRAAGIPLGAHLATSSAGLEHGDVGVLATGPGRFPRQTAPADGYSIMPGPVSFSVIRGPAQAWNPGKKRPAVGLSGPGA